MNSELSTSDIVRQSKKQVCANMDDETILMNLESGNYYGYNTVGGKIWHLMAAPCSVSHIIEQMIDQFDVSEKRCQADVLEFLETLYCEGLIQIVESS